MLWLLDNLIPIQVIKLSFLQQDVVAPVRLLLISDLWAIQTPLIIRPWYGSERQEEGIQ
jgi:hypothetical protein